MTARPDFPSCPSSTVGSTDHSAYRELHAYSVMLHATLSNARYNSFLVIGSPPQPRVQKGTIKLHEHFAYINLLGHRVKGVFPFSGL